VINVCALNGVGFVVVPIRVLKAQVWESLIAGGNHVCKMRHGALVGVLGILIFDKRALAIQVFEFGAFFLNQVRLAGLKIGGVHKLERSHVSDTYCMYMLDFDSIFYEFLSFMEFKFVKMWVNDATCVQTSRHVGSFYVF
jgi:hypothetical protein